MRAKPLFLSIVLLGACQSAVEPVVYALDIQTEGTEFTLSPSEKSVTVPFVISNQGTASAFLRACGGHVLLSIDRREEGQWINYLVSGCITTIPIDPVELGSGKELHSGRRLTEPGEYRFRIGVGEDDGVVRESVSNPFNVN